MNASAIRDKLYDYIRIADDKKIKAIYMMLEDDITEETEWWNNPAFVAELEKEFDAWGWYDDKWTGPGDRFMREAEKKLAQIEKTPERYPERRKGSERQRLASFHILCMFMSHH